MIVLATDSLVPSGVGEHMLTLAGALKADHRMVLAFTTQCGGAPFLARASDAGCQALPISDDNSSVANWLRETPPEIFHIHAGVAWEGHALAAVARNAGVPIVRTEHLPYVLTDEDQKQEHRAGVDTVDRTIFVSEASLETYRQAGASGRRPVTIRNGIRRPHPERSRAETRASLGIADEDFVVITVARFTEQKGYGHLLAAAARLLAHRTDLHLLLVGDGPEKSEMEARAQELGVGTAVRFMGKRDDVPDLLGAADLFVLASLFEGLPLVVLEAMALGLPVVATRIGGTVEALGEEYPWLVAPGDPKSLACAMATALADDEARERIGRKNRRRYETDFVAERMASETAALYRAVVAEGR